MTSLRMLGGLVAVSILPTLVPAQWTSLTGGGAITSVRSMVAVGPDLYAASYPNGVKKSTNGGTLWTPVNTGLPASGANVFCESVGWNGTHLFAGTQSGIYRSDDGGASWTIANGSLAASSTVFANKWFVNAGVTMAIFSGTVAAGGGIWRTTNNGTNWYIGHSGMGSNVTVNAVTLIGTDLWAATNVGLYTSPDNGLNWTAHPVVNYAAYGITTSGANIVILSTFGYRYSSNGGTTWNDATGDPAAPTEGEVASYDGLLYAGTGIDLLRSMDDGASWSSYTGGIGVVDVASLEEFVPAGTRFYVTALLDIYYIDGIGLEVQAPSTPSDLHAWPNPTGDGALLVIPEGGRRLDLIDATGRIIRSVPAVEGKFRTERNGLPAGTYRAVVRDLNGKAVASATLVVE